MLVGACAHTPFQDEGHVDSNRRGVGADPQYTSRATILDSIEVSTPDVAGGVDSQSHLPDTKRRRGRRFALFSSLSFFILIHSTTPSKTLVPFPTGRLC